MDPLLAQCAQEFIFIARPFANFDPGGHIERRLAKPGAVDCSTRPIERLFAAPRDIRVQSADEFVIAMTSGQGTDNSCQKNIEFTRRTKFAGRPFQFALDPFRLLVIQQRGKQRYRRAQASQRNTSLVETFGIAGAQSRHVRNEVVEAAPRNRLERGLRLEAGVRARRRPTDCGDSPVIKA